MSNNEVIIISQGPPGPRGATGPAGPSGGQTVTVPISSAEILDLHDTDKVLIPGVPGFVTMVLGDGIAIAYKAGATPYTIPGDGALFEFAGGVGKNQYWWGPDVGVGFLDQATDQFLGMQAGDSGIGPIALSELDGSDVVLFNFYPNVTDGDGTLIVTLSYYLAPTS